MEAEKEKAEELEEEEEETEEKKKGKKKRAIMTFFMANNIIARNSVTLNAHIKYLAFMIFNLQSFSSKCERFE